MTDLQDSLTRQIMILVLGVRMMESVRTKSADLVDMADLHPQTAKTRRHRARM